jgi:hypothetical protein
MFRILLPILLASISAVTHAQQPPDYIVLKKRNNRTLKTYFPGTFLSGVTYTGATIGGIIKQIKNDSVFLEQLEVKQVPTQFGTPVLDTTIHTIRLHYTEIRAFYYTNTKSSGSGMRRSFVGGKLPPIMALGGTGFIVLELINTAYRGESLSDGNKLSLLAIAAGVAATGFLWQHLQNRNTSTGQKYKVVYVSMATKKSF